jgi:hypothetical protein
MAFGQQSGPPASHHQIRELLELLVEAGHEDFRDARGPMGFTQRQAGGKFTRDEADAFITQLRDEADAASGAVTPDSGTADDRRSARGPAAGAPGAGASSAGAPSAGERLSASEKALRKLPSHRLAAELQRRGWVVMEP